MNDASMIETIILQAPSLIGLFYALWTTTRLNQRLTEALIKRENCDDDEHQ